MECHICGWRTWVEQGVKTRKGKNGIEEHALMQAKVPPCKMLSRLVCSFFMSSSKFTVPGRAAVTRSYMFREFVVGTAVFALSDLVEGEKRWAEV